MTRREKEDQMPKQNENAGAVEPLVVMNCIDCPQHEVIADPDPDDWFCDDDKAVVCKLTLNPGRDVTSKYTASHHIQRSITVACRPYNLRRECEKPEWCPL